LLGPVFPAAHAGSARGAWVRLSRSHPRPWCSAGPRAMLVLATFRGSNSTMQIFGPFRISTAQATGAAQRPQMQPPADSGASRLAGPVDQLDLSSAAQAAGTTARAGGDRKSV